MASDDPFLFCPLGCLPFFSLWPLMTHFSFVYWVVCPSLYGLWWALSLLFIGLCPSLYGLWWAISLLFIGYSVLLLFMASDETFLFSPLGCLSFFPLWPLMNPFSFVHWVVCPSSLCGHWWTLSLLSIGKSALLLFMASDDPSLFVHWVVCPLYDLWRLLSLLSIGFSLLLFMASDDPFLFCPLGCLSFSLWPLMSPFSFVHWVVSFSLWPLMSPSLLFIGLSVLLSMASHDPFFFCPLGCLSSFSLWPLMTPFSFVHWVVCPSSLYDLWWRLFLWSIGLSVLLMASDDPLLFCPLGCLSFFSLWPLMNPFSLVHWVVSPSLYGLWWPLSLLSIGLSVLIFMVSDEPFLFFPLRCLSFFSLWLWWPLSLLSIGLSVLFMASYDPFRFCPLGCLPLFSLWPLMNPFSFVYWVVYPSSLYDLWWWALSPLSIGLSVLLLFMTSDNPFLFCPLGCLSFSLWPLMTPFSFLHWVVSPSSLYGLWWPLSLLSIGLSALLLFMTSDEPFLFCPLACLPFFSLWPLMTPFTFVHWVVCPSLYNLWWPLSLLSNGLSALLLFMASDDPFLFCPLGCLSFFSLLPLMTHFTFVHWVVCPSLYGLWCSLSLLSIGLSALLLFMTSDDLFLFCPLGCLSFFSLWPLMTPFSLCHWVVCPSLYDLWWPLSLLSIGLSVLLFMASDDPFSVVHWIVCSSSLYGLWWPLSLLSIGLSVLLFMASDDSFLFGPLGCLSSLWPLMTPFSFVHWVVCPSPYSLWWTLSLLSIVLSVLLIMTSDDPSLLSIGLSVLLFMASDDTSLFCLLGCLSFPLWPLMTPFSLVHLVVCLSLYGLWWSLSLWSIGLSVLLFMTSDDPVLFCPLDCLSFSLCPLMTPFSFVHWVVYPSLYDLWWPLSLFSIGLSALLLYMASDEPFVLCPLGCLSSLWPLMTPLSFVHWVVSPSSLCGLWWPLSLLSIWVVRPSSLYGLWWALSLLFIGLSVLLFMASDEPFLFRPLGCLPFFSLWPLMIPFFFCPLGCLSFFSLWRLMSPFSFVHWVVCPSSLYDLWWWALSLLSIGLSVLLFMTSDNPFLFCPLGCLSFSLWPLMTPFPFLHWVVCPSSLYGLWWTLSVLSIVLSVLLLFVATDEPFLFCPLGYLPFFSLWPLMTPLSLSIWLSVLFITSEDSFLVCPLGFLSFSLWPRMTPFSFVHWVVCPSSLYGLWWPLSLLSIGLSFLLFMTSDDPFLFCPMGCLPFFSLWPLMTPFSFVHWVVCPSSLYGLWWPISLLSIGLSVLLFITSDDPFLFCPMGCLPFFSLLPLMTSFSFVHWVVCPSSLYDLWWPLSLCVIGLSVLLFMTSDDLFLFCPLGCLSFSLWPLMTLFSLVHWVICPLYDLWWPLSLLSIGLSVLLLFMASDDPFHFCPLGCLSFSLLPLMSPFSFVHWLVCPSSLYYLWWPLSLLSIGLSLPLFMASDEPILFCPLDCLSFFSLWPLMTPFSLCHWVVCPSLYDLWWLLSLWSIGLSVLFMTSDDPFLFCPLGCLSFSL